MDGLKGLSYLKTKNRDYLQGLRMEPQKDGLRELLRIIKGGWRLLLRLLIVLRRKL
ncbi:hypothetical protein HYU45_03485 [Candidatus Daviesbacteria bacterium]|nr:hypothetical protein [Candidatus Daviesbacteria bacterium]